MKEKQQLSNCTSPRNNQQTVKLGYQISLILVNLIEIADPKKAYDLIFLKGLSEDIVKKLVIGKDVTKGLKIEITRDQLIGFLLRSLEHHSRKFLNPAYDVEIMRAFLKELLRYMLSNYKITKKEELLDVFRSQYPQIKLPRNAKAIIAGNVNRSDLQDVLKFGENCVSYLLK